jgi:predicted aspartyl protease
MTLRFERKSGLILVRVELEGPQRSVGLSLALDTGATLTVISQSRLIYVGYDLSAALDRLQMTTVSGIEFVPRIRVRGISTLGQVRSSFSVLAHTLPPNAGIDRLLGLDFFQGKKLMIDLRMNELTLE